MLFLDQGKSLKFRPTNEINIERIINFIPDVFFYIHGYFKTFNIFNIEFGIFLYPFLFKRGNGLYFLNSASSTIGSFEYSNYRFFKLFRVFFNVINCIFADMQIITFMFTKPLFSYKKLDFILYIKGLYI